MSETVSTSTAPPPNGMPSAPVKSPWLINSGTTATTAVGRWTNFGATLPAAFFQGLAASTEMVSPSRVRTPMAPAAVTSSVDAKAEVERDIVLGLYRNLAHVSSWELVPGDRMLLMGDMFSKYTSHSDVCLFALDRVLHTSGRQVSSDAKAAALRYLGIYDSPFDASRLKKLFLKNSSSLDFVTALAAARSLDDVADEAIAGALKPVIATSPFPEVKAVLTRTLQRLKGMGNDETDQNTP